MAGSIEELLDLLYTEIEEAKNAPLSNDRCVIERDRVLDMIDDVKAELPVEIKRAKDLVANKNDYVASAKREADDLRHQAEDYAKRLVNEDAIVREAEKQADEILAEAEEQCRMLRAAASEYCEDTLRRMEELWPTPMTRSSALGQSSALPWGQTTAAPPLGASPPPVGPCTTQRPTRTKTNKQQGVFP